MGNPPPSPRRKLLPHGVPSWVGNDAVYFLTVCCEGRRVNQLCLDRVASAIFESIEFRVARGDWYIHLTLLMPDHCHALVSFPREGDMRKLVSSWKEITAKRVGIRWQRDFFDHRLRSNESYEEKANYIRMNPVRGGLVLDPKMWPFIWEPAEGGPSGPALPTHT
jgi:putative transposase